MYAVRQDTLAGQKTNALFHNRDFSAVPISLWVDALNEYMRENDGALASPEAEAFNFYYTNHVWSLISAKYDVNEVLPPATARLAQQYVMLSGATVARLAYYTLMIITREMRHCYGSAEKLSGIKGITPAMCSYIQELRTMNEEVAVAHLKENPPKGVSVFEYCNAMDKAFEFGGFNSQFGNKPWAVVAETLGKLTKGVLTPEMFADTAFTLCHNNGPIFNKGMLYSSFDKARIAKLLDVQRSGQVPQYLAGGFIQKHMVSPNMHLFIAEATSVFPEELTGYVDWFKVEALGAMGTYPLEKDQQVALHGPSPFNGKGKKGGDNLYFVGVKPQDAVKVYKRPKKMMKVA